ncbi:MAG: hypothetical protein HY558_06900 [Euryarchaeota archaeon]|nr:hypothetical protein [Euryarchaeota archaeon]
MRRRYGTLPGLKWAAALLLLGLVLLPAVPAEAKHASMQAYVNYTLEDKIEDLRNQADIAGLYFDHDRHGGYAGGAGMVEDANDSYRPWHIRWNKSRYNKGDEKLVQLVTELRNNSGSPVPGLPDNRDPEQQFDFVVGALANRSGDLFSGLALITENTTLYSLPYAHNNTARYGTGQTRGGLYMAYWLRTLELALHRAGEMYMDVGRFFSA